MGKLIEEANPDIICFQETKCDPNFFKCFQFEEFPYTYWNYSISTKKGRKVGYSGTSIWSKIPALHETIILPTLENPDIEGRIQIVEFKTFVLINTYVPNSGSNLEYRRDQWDPAMYDYLQILLSENKNIIWCGDFNVANEPIDIHHGNPKSYNKRIIEGKDLKNGFLPFERDNFKSFLSLGMIDVYRHLYPNEIDYTWWDPKIKVFRKINRGWRIDYFLVSKSLEKYIIDSKILRNIGLETQPQGSDHAPITLTFSVP